MRKSIYSQSDLNSIKEDVENALQDESIEISEYNGYPTISFEYINNKRVTFGYSKALGCINNKNALELFISVVDTIRNEKQFKQVA